MDPQPEKLVPEQVFTPRTLVTRKMFERRNEPDSDGNPGVQDRLVDAIRDRGGQVLMYGDTGVGKSSLLKYVAEDLELKLVTIECTANTDYAGMLDDVVRKLLDVRETKFTKRRNFEAGVSAEGSVPWFTKLSGTVKGAVGRDTEYQVIEKPAVDVVTELLSKSGISLLVLDNFQNVRTESTRELVAQLLERFSDRASDDWNEPDAKCVVVGISEDATSLLGSSRSYLRRTAQIGVPRMPDDEIRALLARGFELLGMEVPDGIMKDFVFYSDGFPYFAHLIGLNVARAALRSGDEAVGRAQLMAALTEAARSVTASYQDRVRLAKERNGDVRPRTQIMKLLANDSRRSWTGSEIQDLWVSNIGGRDNFAAIHVALGNLVTEQYGTILKRTGKQGSYRYRFADPHIRPFLRITETDET